jgi:hypothetical protein
MVTHIFGMCVYCVIKKYGIIYQICSLYGRKKPYLVCFNCRIPFYEKKIKTGEIYKLTKRKIGD